MCVCLVLGFLLSSDAAKETGKAGGGATTGWSRAVDIERISLSICKQESNDMIEGRLPSPVRSFFQELRKRSSESSTSKSSSSSASTSQKRKRSYRLQVVPYVETEEEIIKKEESSQQHTFAAVSSSTLNASSRLASCRRKAQGF